MLTEYQKKSARNQFVYKLYEMTQSNELEVVEGIEIFNEMGVNDPDDKKEIMDFLHNNGFVKCISLTEDYSSLITEKGKDHAKNKKIF